MVNANDTVVDPEDPGLYGAFAEGYERIMVPLRFEAPARDLLAMVEPTTAGPLLDVGTGTGVILDLCAQPGGRFGPPVGIDPSIGMLGIARSKGHPNLVTASTPGLPFPDSVFGVIVASFVLSHVESIDDSAKDMTRVLKSGGRLAASSWGDVQNVYKTVWLETVREFVDQESLHETAHHAVPNEESLEAPGVLEQVLRKSGLTEVRGQVKTYQKSETAVEFVEVRSSMVSSRIMAHRLGPRGWRRFRNCVLERLSNLGEPLTYSISVNLSTGCKP